MPLKQRRYGLVVVACTLLSACVADSQSVRDRGPDLAIGWLHGNCLALDDAAVRAGSRVAVVMLGEMQQVVSAEVTGDTDGAGNCLALLDDRKEVNLRGGRVFYEIDADVEVELGIGIVQIGGSRTLTLPELLDTNRDGQRDHFASCTASEGVQFSVWADEAWRGTPLWTRYYYLGYDTDPGCHVGE